MGCDIHGWVEARPFAKSNISDDWYSYVNAENVLGRNYDMFAKLFGVRLEVVEQRSGQKVVSIASQRGLPEYGRFQKDSPHTTIDDYREWKGDAHSVSWISYKELKKAISENDFQDSRMEALFEMMTSLSKLYDEENVRLVVWFDN